MGFENTSGRGVLSHYGPRPISDKKYGGSYGTKDAVKKAEWVFDYDDLPVGSTSELALSIPANAMIVSARFEVITGFTSTSTTSDLLIGLEQADGTDIDLDGLLSATDLTQTVIANVGSLTVGSGALVGDTIGAAAGQLYVAPSVADLLTGKARVLVEYVEQSLYA